MADTSPTATITTDDIQVQLDAIRADVVVLQAQVALLLSTVFPNTFLDSFSDTF